MNARCEARLERAAGLSAMPGWAEQNQRWLAAEVARLRERITPRLRDDSAARAATDPPPAPSWPGDADAPPALERIVQIFGLSPFERDLLLLAAGMELERALRALLPAPLSFSLAMSLLDAPHWDALSPLAPLRHWRLLDLGGADLPAHAPLAIDERVLHALTGVAAIDQRLRGIARQAGPAAAAQAGASVAVAAALVAAPAPLVLVAGQGPIGRAPAVWRDSAVAGVRAQGSLALLVNANEVLHEAQAAEDLACRLDREAALSGAVPVLWGEVAPDAQRRLFGFIDRLRGPLVLALEVDRARLRAAVQRSCIAIECGSEPELAARAHDPGLRTLLQQFRVDAALLEEVQAEAHARGLARDSSAWRAAVRAGLRQGSRGGLEALAQRMDSDTALADLVLPPAQIEQLRSIAAQLEHRHTVHEDWGFARRASRGLGIAALFAGESGTGKTMAAEAIANQAGLDLFRIDLASTVSKYIGETEKNLARLFDAAEASGAVLLFDEADALFGKRSEVKDSHDRYANIEIAYLLQRIETYRGLAILTTNLKSSLDKTFLRRIRFVVQFPFPDETMRERLWRLQLPGAAPRGEIDYAALARAPLSGGHIRCAALQAAFAAAERAQPIDQALLMGAVRAEFAKLERPFTAANAGAMT